MLPPIVILFVVSRGLGQKRGRRKLIVLKKVSIIMTIKVARAEEINTEAHPSINGLELVTLIIINFLTRGHH